MKEKQNYCTPQGACDCPDDNNDTGCKYCAPHGQIPDKCIYRIMHADKCLSPFALYEAWEAA